MRRTLMRRTSGADLALLGMAGLLAWQLALYPLILGLLGRGRKRQAEAREEHLPPLTVLVPTYNEATVIRQRLENLAESEYPPDLLQVIVIDSASTDGTSEQVKEYQRASRLRDLELIQERERRGKAAALNLALARTHGDIVVMTDAPTLFAPDTLRRIVSNFTEPSIGAVSGIFRVPEQTSLAQQEEALFWALRDRLRLLEAQVDSTPFLSGELCCFRRQLVHTLAEDTVADDMNVALQVRKAGYRTIVDPRAIFWEPRSASFSELTVTKTRRAIGGLQELLRFRDMWFRSRYGIFGMLILPSAFLYYVPFRTLLLVMAGLRLLGQARRRPWLLPLGAASATLGLLAAGERRRDLLRLLVLAGFNEWIFLRAFVALALGRYSVRWEQERSTRRPSPEPVPALAPRLGMSG